MHMADALISPAIGTTFWVVSGLLLTKAAKQIANEKNTEKISFMAVLGAFIFAAQMINFTIPATGSSGHIGGGLLLATLLGPAAAFLTIAAVLFIQAVLFADGGLLAYGCNLFNMGFWPCFLVYPFFIKPILNRTHNKNTLILISIVGAVLGLQLGSLFVVLQTFLSGITALPFTHFLLLMQPIHFAIGIGEGLITGLVLTYVRSVNPNLLTITQTPTVTPRKLLLTFFTLALITGGLLSLFASSYPDGLEWSIAAIIGETELNADSKIHTLITSVQETLAILPDYNFSDSTNLGTSFSGILGSLLTLGLIASGIKLIQQK